MLKPFYSTPMLLMRIAAGLPLVNAIQQVVVPLPDPRVTAYVGIVWVPDFPSTSPPTPPGQKKAWVVARVKSEQLANQAFPVTNLLGTGNASTAVMGDLIDTSLPATHSLQGYAREFSGSAADEVFIDARLDDVATSGQTGNWMLVCKYAPDDTMCEPDWITIQQLCQPKNLGGGVGTSPN